MIQAISLTCLCREHRYYRYDSVATQSRTPAGAAVWTAEGVALVKAKLAAYGSISARRLTPSADSMFGICRDPRDARQRPP